MRLKKRPVTPVRLPKLEIESRPLKAPPCELPARRIEDPVGLEPFEDVVVAGEEDGLPRGPLPGLAEGQRAESRDLAVDDGGELVDNDLCRRLADEPREARAELLAVGEHGIRPQPRGHGTEADSRQRGRDRVEVSLGGNRVDDRFLRRPGWLPDGGVAEDLPTQ